MSHACKLNSSAQKEAVSGAGDHNVPTGLSQSGTVLCPGFSLLWSLSCVHQLRDMTHENLCQRHFLCSRGKIHLPFPLSFYFSLYKVVPLVFFPYVCIVSLSSYLQKWRFMFSTNSHTLIFYTSEADVFKVLPFLFWFHPHYWGTHRFWQCWTSF